MRHDIEIALQQLDVLRPADLHAAKESFDSADFKTKIKILDKISKTIIEMDFGDAKRFGYDREKKSFTVDGEPVEYATFNRVFGEAAAVKRTGHGGVNKSGYERGIGSSTITRNVLSQGADVHSKNGIIDSFSQEALLDISTIIIVKIRYSSL